ncbi:MULTISPECIES: alcohol dehydrogenase catalytic domain-containing protein [unclassified Mesorhizobium]|uniref:alcohol dehydrogenase catalytic domain-containing protein n=1 Tax=unclassified Mesorhizobium TaxID=325217 RepID=UPI001FF00A81|nr:MULTISPECIES: alcohol dehydrogenase catalytic domain-containing protein [unclassified Mesorhizobium]
MAIPSEMKALLLVGDGYTRAPSGSVLEAMEPYLKPGSIAVPAPGPTQVLIKVSLASINPSDVAFIKGQYGQPRLKGRPAGFEGVGVVVAGGDEPYPKSLVGKRVASPPGSPIGAHGPTMPLPKPPPAFRSSTPCATRMGLP